MVFPVYSMMLDLKPFLLTGCRCVALNWGNTQCRCDEISQWLKKKNIINMATVFVILKHCYFLKKSWVFVYFLSIHCSVHHLWLIFVYMKYIQIYGHWWHRVKDLRGGSFLNNLKMLSGLFFSPAVNHFQVSFFCYIEVHCHFIGNVYSHF